MAETVHKFQVTLSQKFLSKLMNKFEIISNCKNVKMTTLFEQTRKLYKIFFPVVGLEYISKTLNKYKKYFDVFHFLMGFHTKQF